MSFKSNPDHRFQSRAFVKKLDNARQYKRPVRRSVVGNGSGKSNIFKWVTWYKVLIFFGFAAVVYLLCGPQLFGIKNINVFGISSPDSLAIASSIKEYSDKQPWYLLQKNILFLNKSALSKYLTDHHHRIDLVEKVDKQILNKKLSVYVQAELRPFIISDGVNFAALYLDGQSAGVIPAVFWEQAGPNILKIKLSQVQDLSSGQIISEKLAKFLDSIRKELLLQTQQKIDFAEIATQSSNELKNTDPQIVTFYVRKNNSKDQYKIIAEPSSDPKNLISRLNLLLGQTSQERYNALVYIDMRLDNRSFLCLQGATCAKQPVAVNPKNEQDNK